MLVNKDILEENDTTFSPLGKKCLQNHYHAFNEEDIYSFINNVIIKGEDTLKEKRIKFVNKTLKVNYPNASGFIVKYLKDTLKWKLIKFIV